MTEENILKANTKKDEQKPNSLRQQGLLPAVLYGRDEKNIHLILDYGEFNKVYQKAGGSSLVGLKIDKQEPVPVLIQEAQTDPVTDKFIHVDFYKVKMDQKITAHIKLVFEGESPAVKELSGVLVKNISEIEVECLPGDLVHEIKVDLTSLKEINDVITLKDLGLPEALEPSLEADEVIATVVAQQVEKEPVPAEAEPAVEGEETAAEGEAKAEEGENKETPKEKTTGKKE